MKITEYKNKLMNKYNGIDKKEYDNLSYGDHFKYAKTTFTKGNLVATMYVPHQKPESTFEESAFDSYIPKANLNTREVMQFDPSNSFQIGDNLKGGI